MKGIGLLVASVAVIGMSACRDRQGQLQQDRTTVRDSAGTAIVVNRASAEMTDWRLAPTPERVIGDPEAHPVAQLFRAYSATRTGTGDIVIGNSGTSQILVVTKDGSLLAAFGRRGRGPGEFGGMARVIASDADAILIEDLGLQRKLLRFTLTGELVEEVVLPTRVIFRGGAWSDPAASPAGVEFILAEPLDAPNLGRVTRPQRGPLFVVRFTYHGDGPDTLATYPGTELFNADVGPQPAFGGGTASGPRSVAPLFGSKTRLAGGGTPWRAVVADQARASYDVFGEDGSLVRRVQWQATGRVPTSRDITLAREEFVRSRRQDPAARVGPSTSCRPSKRLRCSTNSWLAATIVSGSVPTRCRPMLRHNGGYSLRKVS